MSPLASNGRVADSHLKACAGEIGLVIFPRRDQALSFPTVNSFLKRLLKDCFPTAGGEIFPASGIHRIGICTSNGNWGCVPGVDPAVSSGTESGIQGRS